MARQIYLQNEKQLMLFVILNSLLVPHFIKTHLFSKLLDRNHRKGEMEVHVNFMGC